ncbi:MAG: hypothetical protein AAGA30_21610 [Planctomycetota bacterium]
MLTTKRRAVEELRNLGVWVYFDYQYSDGRPSLGKNSTYVVDASPNVPKLLVDILGVDFFYSVVHLDLMRKPHEAGETEAVPYAAPEWADSLDWIPNVMKLSIKGDQVDINVLEKISKLNHLEELSILGTNNVSFPTGSPVILNRSINDECIQILAEAPALRKLAISRCELGDDSLNSFSTFKQLESLVVEGKFSEESIRNLKERLPETTVFVTNHSDTSHQ